MHACVLSHSMQAKYWLLDTRDNPWPISFPSLTDMTDIHHPRWEAAAGIIPKSIPLGGKPLALTATWLSPPLPACHQELHLHSSPETGVPHREGSRARTGPSYRMRYTEICVQADVCPSATYPTLTGFPCSRLSHRVCPPTQS